MPANRLKRNIKRVNRERDLTRGEARKVMQDVRMENNVGNTFAVHTCDVITNFPGLQTSL